MANLVEHQVKGKKKNCLSESGKNIYKITKLKIDQSYKFNIIFLKGLGDSPPCKPDQKNRKKKIS